MMHSHSSWCLQIIFPKVNQIFLSSGVRSKIVVTPFIRPRSIYFLSHTCRVWQTRVTDETKMSKNSNYCCVRQNLDINIPIWIISLSSAGQKKCSQIFLAATAALEVQMLVCVFVCVSHLLQQYWTFAGLLQDFCRTSQELLKVFWRTSGTSQGLLKDFWRTFEGLLKDFWRTSEGLLKDCWKTSEGHLKDFWRTSEGFLKDFWRTSEGLLTLDYKIY